MDAKIFTNWSTCRSTNILVCHLVQTSDSVDDDVKEHIDTMTPIRLNSDDEPNWAELSQHLSFSTGATSPAQVCPNLFG